MSNKEIASTILSQLGGNKFIVMTGAKNLVAIEKGLILKFGRNSSKANHLKITLKNDLYDMEFLRVHGTKITTIKKYEQIYNDQLESLFQETTGMATKLF